MKIFLKNCYHNHHHLVFSYNEIPCCATIYPCDRHSKRRMKLISNYLDKLHKFMQFNYCLWLMLFDFIEYDFFYFLLSVFKWWMGKQDENYSLFTANTFQLKRKQKQILLEILMRKNLNLKSLFLFVVFPLM